ncbi:MAG: hypothetical protein R3335_15140, partial [Anaerolineales bacterium]|nr:hypothetical protein [Anaerolineales bacterium]
YPLSGGTIAAVPVLQHALGIESILTGYNLPEDLVHSPNESLHLPTWSKGITTLVHFINKFQKRL